MDLKRTFHLSKAYAITKNALEVKTIIWLVISIVAVVTFAWILDNRDRKINNTKKESNKIDESRNILMGDNRFTNDG